MKTNSMSALLTVCGLVISAEPVSAQEQIKPASPPTAEQANPDKPRDPPPTAAQDQQHKVQPKRRSTAPSNTEDRPSEWNRRPQPEMKPASYIGVMTHLMSPELAAQTGLAEGFGLVVEEVMADSPAMKAGIKQHDVLVTFADQKLVNQEQLSALVRAEKKDAEVVFTVKRAGMDQKVTVKIGEKMMPVADRRGSDGGNGPWYGLFNGRDGEHFGDQLRDNAERIERELRENGGRFGEGIKQFGERMKEWSRGPGDHPAPQAPKLDREGDRRDGQPPPNNDRRSNEAPRGNGPVTDRIAGNSSSSTSVFQRNATRRDESGEYSLREDNGAKVFSVKPKDGEEQTFIVNTDRQRDAIPEQFRAKLKELETVNPPTPPPAAEKVQPRQ